MIIADKLLALNNNHSLTQPDWVNFFAHLCDCHHYCTDL